MPVTLFITVCNAINSFRKAYPEIRLTALIAAITMSQKISHAGICRTGISFIRQQSIIIKPVTVSSFDPNSLTVPVFLATVPSNMSLIPEIDLRNYKALFFCATLRYRELSIISAPPHNDEANIGSSKNSLPHKIFRKTPKYITKLTNTWFVIPYAWVIKA